MFGFVGMVAWTSLRWPDPCLRIVPRSKIDAPLGKQKSLAGAVHGCCLEASPGPHAGFKLQNIWYFNFRTWKLCPSCTRNLEFLEPKPSGIISFYTWRPHKQHFYRHPFKRSGQLPEGGFDIRSHCWVFGCPGHLKNQWGSKSALDTVVLGHLQQMSRK